MKVFFVVCMVCGAALQSFALDREAFTFTSYELNVRVEPEQRRLGVRGKIRLRNDSVDPQDSFVLQISSSLDWRSIRVGGKAAHFVTEEYNSDIDHTGALSEAIVNLAKDVPPKGTLELEVGYEGVIPLDTSRLTRVGVPEDKAKHADWDQIGKAFTAVRGIGYVVWYPVAMEDASLSEGNSVEETIGRWKAKEASTAMVVSLESTMGAVMFSGTEEHKSSSKAGQFSMVNPGLDVPTFVIGDYQKFAAKDGGADVYYLAGQQDAAAAYGEIAAEVKPLVPDNHEAVALKIVALPDPDAQPFVTEGMLLTPLNTPMTNEIELSIVYAKARQTVPSPRAWIEDGLAHFAQAEFIEKQKGRQSALDYLTSHAARLADAKGPHVALSDSPDDLYLQVKAMYVWWMLRDMLGSLPVGAFEKYRASEDNDAAYMPQLIKKESGRDLQWFFEDWVYHDRGLPDFRVASVFSTAIQGGGFLVTVTIENLGNAGAEVPVILQAESNEEMRKRIEVRAKAKASIRFETHSAPKKVTVNDGSVPESDVTNNTYKVEQTQK